MIPTCKSSLQQLLKLLLLRSSQTKVQKYFLTTQCFPVPGSGENSNEDTECVTGQLLVLSLYLGVRRPDMKCKLWKNHDLLGSPDRGCGLTMDTDTKLCSATTLKAICKDWGPEDYDQLLLPRNSCEKGSPCRFVYAGLVLRGHNFCWIKYK